MINMIIVFLCMFLFLLMISWLWVKGIDNMKNKHPDYKGEEFLNWDRKNDDWDNTAHTEGEI